MHFLFGFLHVLGFPGELCKEKSWHHKCTQPNPPNPSWDPKLPQTKDKHLGQLKLLLENYHFTTSCFFSRLPDSNTKAEQEAEAVRALSDCRHSGLACSKATHIPTSPGCSLQSTTAEEKKPQISHLGKTLEPHKCVIYPESGAASQH